MGRTFARMTDPPGVWRAIPRGHVPHSVRRALEATPTEDDHLLAIALHPDGIDLEGFDPEGAITRTLSLIRASGLTDPIMWTTWFGLPRRQGRKAQQWLTESAHRWPWDKDITWRAPDTRLALWSSSYPDGDGLSLTAWGPTALQLLDQIADLWPPSTIGVDPALALP